jgi:hypothetical protein
MRPLSRSLLRSRALHFAVLGGALWIVAPRTSDAGSHITISSRDLDALHAAHASRLGVAALTPAQRAEVDARAIEDDVLYREAIRLGLDRGDIVVRQHLVQKVLLLAEDMGGATRTPTDAELRAFYEETRSRWTKDASVRFVHVFAAKHDAILALRGATLASTEDPPLLGDAFPTSRDVRAARAGVATAFGDTFADAVFAQPIGAWSEPIESKLGWHLVKVISKDGGRPATYEDVKAQLPLEWALEQRHRATAAFLARAYARYEITIDGAKQPAQQRTTRLAMRTDPSGED